MLKRLDENWRHFWWAHLLHAVQGCFVASLVAGDWVVAGCLYFAGYAFYQVVEYVEYRYELLHVSPSMRVYARRDRIVRDWKVFMVGFTVGLVYYFLSGASLIQGLRGLWGLWSG